MDNPFAAKLQMLRKEKNISQQQLAAKMFVGRSTIANWETGRRVPDALFISRLANCLDIDVAELLSSARISDETPNLIYVDNDKSVLSIGLPTLEKIFPDAQISGFNEPSDALRFSEDNRVDLAFLDIELGSTTGFELCKHLLEINPGTNVIFVTSHVEYAFDAWSTGACGFVLKPLTEDKVRAQMNLLRYPIANLIF